MKRGLTPILLSLFAVGAPVQGTKAEPQVATTATPSHVAHGSGSTALAPSEIFSRARSSVVVIIAADQSDQHEALGSGFVVNQNRVVTNHHVVEGMSRAAVVFSDGSIKLVSKVIADNVQQDLIVLAVQTGNRQPLAFGDELSLQQGDSVYALGAPKGLELSFTNGIVSSFRRSNSQFLIQTTAPIAPGSSGGPLFDHAGRVVGVTTSLLADAPGIYFSVGIGDVKRLLRTPQGVALPFEEWAKQRSTQPPSGSFHKSAPNQGPSLQDTISWMQNFSQSHRLRFFHGKPFISMVFFPDPLHQKASAPGCAVWVGIDHYQVEKSGDLTAEVEFFDLSDINPDSVKATDPPGPDGVAVLVFETSDASRKVHFALTSNPFMTSEKLFASEVQANSDYRASLGTIVLDSPESNERFATALKHAVILCGGTGAPF